MKAMSRMYESLMEGLMEDLYDIQEYGEPQGRKTAVDHILVREYSAAKVKSIRKDVEGDRDVFLEDVKKSKKCSYDS